MPRPITNDEPAPPGTSAPIEMPKARVDAPDARYQMVRIRLDGLQLHVLDRQFEEIGSYAFDEIPTVVNGGLLGTSGGKILSVVVDPACACHGSFKEMKTDV